MNIFLSSPPCQTPHLQRVQNQKPTSEFAEKIEQGCTNSNTSSSVRVVFLSYEGGGRGGVISNLHKNHQATFFSWKPDGMGWDADAWCAAHGATHRAHRVCTPCNLRWSLTHKLKNFHFLFLGFALIFRGFFKKILAVKDARCAARCLRTLWTSCVGIPLV